jgi:anaerobic selenocysteine-containing dehydrogenase
VEITRRDFIKLMGGVSGVVAATSFGLNQMLAVPDILLEKAINGPGIETWASTICRQCPGGCGIQVRLIDGIPVYIKGNPIYPVNQGGMCPLGHGALEQLFNPDRIKEPMRRIGISGSGKWEPISWDDALKSIAEKLSNLREEGKAHQVAFLGYDEQGLMKEFISRFMKSYGSPNYYQFHSAQGDTVPFQLTHGIPRIPAYDFLNTKFVVSFGANFLEEGYAPVYYTKMYSSLREISKQSRARFIQIESRMSLTAANADRWIPIRPGTYGALALGIAFVLIREELFDSDFVTAHTFGFEDWKDRTGQKHLGFKNMVLNNYYPENVSEITGVKSETILEIGRDLGNTRPALVLGNQGAVDNTNGTFTQMAIHSLNALLGNFESDGGIFFIDEPPFIELPYMQENAAAAEGNQQIPIAAFQNDTFPLNNFSDECFTNNILESQPYPITLLFLYKGNPLFQSLNHHNLAEALKKIPMVVSFDSFINETSEYADLILPDHTFLEKWDEVSQIPSVGFTHVGIQQPIVDPFYQTRHTGDVLINLANNIGGAVAASFPFKNYKDEVRFRMESIYKSGEGAIASEGVKSSWLEYLRQRGWHIGRYDSFEEFWELLLENGGWWNPIRKKKNWVEIFKTPSGKFEFYSQTLKEKIDSLVEKKEASGSIQNLESLLNDLNITVRGDMVFLPHHDSILYDDDMPLYLTTYQLLTNRDGHGSNLPMMQEMFGYTVRQYWRSWVEIHPQTASNYGISNNDWIWIESAIGTLKAQVRIHPGIMPSVICIPFGLGHTSYGRYAKGYGINPNSILKNLYDMVSGKPALQATKVNITVAT